MLVSPKRPSQGAFLFQAAFWQNAGWVFLATAWLNASHYLPWLNFQAEFLGFAGLGLLLGGWSRARNEIWRFPLVAVWAAGIVLIPLVQYAFGLLPYAGDVWLAALYSTGFAFAICIGFWIAEAGKRDATGIGMPWAIAIAVPAVLSALIALLQWLHLTEPLGVFVMQAGISDRPGANLAQANQLGTLLIMGMVSVWYLFERQVISRALTIPLVLVLICGVGLTQSRTALLGLTVGVIFLSWKLRKSTPALKAWRTSLTGLGLFAFTAWATYYLVPIVSQALMLAKTRNTSLVDPNGRIALWQQIAYAIQQSPWIGYGWNQTIAAQEVGASAVKGTVYDQYAHNLFLDLLAWTGLPIGVLLTLACVYWVVSRALRVQCVGGVASMAAIIPICVHSMLEYPFAYAYFLLTLGILIGCVEAVIGADVGHVRVSKPLFTSVVLVWWATGLLVAWEYLKVEEEFRVVRFASMRVGQIPAGHKAPSIHMLTQLDAMLEAGRMDPRPGMSPSQLRTMRLMAQRAMQGSFAYKYALALALNGDLPGARSQFRTIRGKFGERYYRNLLDDLRGPQTALYPQLAELNVE